MSIFSPFSFLIIAVGLSGCASSTHNVGTIQVDKTVYSDLSCGELKRNLADTLAQISELHNKINNASSDDAIQVYIGITVFLPALLLAEGGNQADGDRYARLKGEVIAMRDTAFDKECEFTKPANKGK